MLVEKSEKKPLDDNLTQTHQIAECYMKDLKYIGPTIYELQTQKINKLILESQYVYNKNKADKTHNKNKLNYTEETDKVTSLDNKIEKITFKVLVRTWFGEVLKGLKQLMCGGTLHGVKYMYEPTFSTIERLTWVIIVVISIATCSCNIIQLFCKWTSTPFVNVIDSLPTPVWAIPFPTVVVCPHLHVKASFRNVSRLRRGGLERFYASLICPRKLDIDWELDQRLSHDEIEKLHQFIVEASPKCDEVVKGCFWRTDNETEWINCCDNRLFKSVFSNYGLCFGFNTLPLNGMTNLTLKWHKTFDKEAYAASLDWHLDRGYPKVFPNTSMQPDRVMGSGESNGLGIELYFNRSEHQLECDGSSFGFTIIIGSPTDNTYTSTVLRLPLDRMTTIEVAPISYKTDNGLRSLKAGQRQCFFQDERQLDFYEFYTDSNCKHDMLMKKTKKECDCVKYNWPRKSKRDPICTTKEDFECTMRAKAKVENELIEAYYKDSDELNHKGTTNSCHPSCNDLLYSTQVYYSDLSTELRKIEKGKSNEGEYTRVNVHFYDDIFLGQHRHAQYDEYYFAGAIGGLLSLFLGFSIISVAEIVYFVILRPILLLVVLLYKNHDNLFQ